MMYIVIFLRVKMINYREQKRRLGQGCERSLCLIYFLRGTDFNRTFIRRKSAERTGQDVFAVAADTK